MEAISWWITFHLLGCPKKPPWQRARVCLHHSICLSGSHSPWAHDPFPNFPTVTSLKNTVIAHNISPPASPPCLAFTPGQWKALHSTKSNHKSSTHPKAKGFFLWGFPNREKECISGSDPKLLLSGQAELLQVTAARAQGWFPWLCVSHSRWRGQGRRNSHLHTPQRGSFTGLHCLVNANIPFLICSPQPLKQG